MTAQAQARARLRRAAAGAAAAVAIAVIAGGCTAPHGGAGPLPQATAGRPGGSPPARAAGDARPAGPARIPLKVPNQVPARRAVTLARCTATPGGGLAAGTVTAARAGTYAITVFFTTRAATVIGYAAATVHANPGKATRWQASGHFTAPRGMRCVLRGVTTR
jgi:hypothetical protein